MLDVIQTHLRELFIKEWNTKYPKMKWTSDRECGKNILSKFSENVLKKKEKSDYIKLVETGDEMYWDTSTLVFVLLYSGIGFMDGLRDKKERSDPLRKSEQIDIIRELRNSVFAHRSSMKCSNEELNKFSIKIKGIAFSLFGERAKHEIEQIENSHIVGRIEHGDKNKQDKEFIIYQALQSRVKGKFKASITLAKTHRKLMS